jgi:nitroimidazol reductase NimA-like FMN-containing flavoprotein (pyridoxamine 5'-phosphate oxidase superfamily)
MRRKEKEIQNLESIQEIIRQSQVCRLAMVDQGKPYVVPLSFGFDDTHLYFHSAPAGRKIDVLRQNPHVCFEFDRMIRLVKAKQACDWGVSFQSVIGEGTAELVTDPGEKVAALERIMAHYSGRTFRFSDEAVARTVVIRVAISRMTGKQSGVA